jgi:hypothetical protein
MLLANMKKKSSSFHDSIPPYSMCVWIESYCSYEVSLAFFKDWKSKVDGLDGIVNEDVKWYSGNNLNLYVCGWILYTFMLSVLLNEAHTIFLYRDKYLKMPTEYMYNILSMTIYYEKSLAFTTCTTTCTMNCALLSTSMEIYSKSYLSGYIKYCWCFFFVWLGVPYIPGGKGFWYDTVGPYTTDTW